MHGQVMLDRFLLYVYVLFQQVHFVDKHLDRTLYEQFHLIVENRNTHDIHHPI